MCIMWFVDLINENLCCFFHKRIEVIFRCLFAAFSGQVKNENAPCTVFDIQCQKAFFHIHTFCDICQSLCIDRISRFSIAADSFCHVDFQDLLFRIRFVPRSSFQKFQIDTHLTHRSLHIIAAHIKIFFQILWIAFFHFTIRISCWEMGVVEDPDFHLVFFCFRKNQIQIAPPLISNEVRMRACLYAHPFHPTFCYLVHIFTQYRMFFSMLPKKWI